MIKHCKSDAIKTNGPSIRTATGSWWWINEDVYGHRYYGPYNHRGEWRIHGRLIK
jgi:hypothetical protein